MPNVFVVSDGMLDKADPFTIEGDDVTEVIVTCWESDRWGINLKTEEHPRGLHLCGIWFKSQEKSWIYGNTLAAQLGVGISDEGEE